jgi:hypothetical protein
LAHVIRETEKYYHLHVQAAEPREMTVWFSQSKGLRTKGVEDVYLGAQRLENEELHCPRAGEELEKRVNLSFLHIFILLGSSKDWKLLSHIGECLSSLLSLLIQRRVSGNTLSDTPRAKVLLLSGYPLTQPNWQMKLIITMDNGVNRREIQVAEGKIFTAC